MRDKVRLIRLREAAEARDQRERYGPAEAIEIEIQVVKAGEKVRGVQTWKDGVPKIPCLSLIRVRESANVAVEARITEVCLEALECGGVVTFAVAVDNVGGDAGAFGVARVDKLDCGSEVSIVFHTQRDK